MDLSRVVRPGDEAGVAAALAAGEKTLIQGGGTRSGLGAPVDRADVRLSMTGLAGIVEHHASDFTVEAWAGTTVAALNRELAASGQFLPLDPPLPERATLGGAIAAGETGYRKAPGARAADLVLGLRAVLGDGTPIRSGGRVVKNVTGYDLGRLFTGSLGTLGALTRVTLRLRALPEASRTVLRKLPPDDALETFVERVVAAMAEEPEAVAVAPGQDGFVLAVRTEGLREEAAAGLPGPGIEDEDDFWARVRDFPVEEPRRLGAFGLRGAGSRVAVLETAWRWAEWGPALALPAVPRAYAAIPPAHLDAALRAASVPVAIESAAPGMAPENPFHPPPAAPVAALMRRIRIALDPRDTLAPGRFPWTR